MFKDFKNISRFKNNTYLVAMMLVVAFALSIRSFGLYPLVFADEYTYSKFARLLPFSEANIPGYLYFLIYKTTNLCGDGFLGCSRLLNAVFFVLAAPFIYLIGKKVAGEKTALLIACLSILGPINSYTAYFMPESLYFLSFWALSYFLLMIKKTDSIWHWIFLGAVFGISALIKPHALFLIPVFVFYFFIVQRQSLEKSPQASSSLPLYGQYIAFFGAAIFIKLLLGFMLAGKNGINFFGAGYSSVASGSVADPHRYIALVKLAFENLQGHLLALTLMFSVPMAYVLSTFVFFLKRDCDFDLRHRIARNIALYAVLTLVFLLIVVTLFTASISSSGPYETNARLHMRYYNFALPLLLLAAASQLSLPSAFSTKCRLIVGLPLVVAVLYAIYTHLAAYTPSFVDNPELRGFTFNPKTFYVLSSLSFIALLGWIYHAKIGARIFLYLFMPLSVVLSTVYVNQELRQRLVLDVFDKAGMFTKQYLSNEEISKVVIVGSNPAALFRSLFYLDNPNAAIEIIPEKSILDITKLPSDKEWVLLIGEHTLSKNAFYQLPMNGFTLARIRLNNIEANTNQGSKK